ncbi:phosphoribosyl-AMP cyclohydrolase [Parasphingopyxis sp.]|uniref:phosphoribosyl-AMP cyclohydrolase n=1 Tax=Parasphingopyxis sp. TaxID=1920299 RepID=UPI00260A7753|nr:phosphoribosyl-AMP cyclohydrolase [Parasphingopyxis sp.]
MTRSSVPFADRTSVEQVELGDELAPRFDAEGLSPVIVINAADQSVLMLGYMNAEALEQTLLTREAHFWSRSRETLWRKGEHSGFTQAVERILIDDDQDALILFVRIEGPGSCHVGYKSCFYREIDLKSVGADAPVKLIHIEPERAFDADAVYAGLPNPTRL